jgi:hypothetical protein
MTAIAIAIQRKKGSRERGTLATIVLIATLARVGRAIHDAHAAEAAVDAVRSEHGTGLEARILGSTQSVHVGRVVTAGH